MTDLGKTLAYSPMSEAPKGPPVIMVSGWGQVAVCVWDPAVSKWRYGPQPGCVWDEDYPVGWVKVHACGWRMEPDPA